MSQEIQKIQIRIQELYNIPLYVEPRQWFDCHAQELRALEARAKELGYERDYADSIDKIRLIRIDLNRAKMRRRK